MRADRLLSLLILLQLRGRTSAQKLAQELEVSERTIYRDLQALSAAGVPVYAERGPGGGCELLDNYRTTLTGLNEDELRALFMLNIPAPLNDLGVSHTLRSALLKLAAALPGTSRITETHTRQRIHLDSSPQSHTNEPAPYLRTLYQAIWSDRRVEIAYRFWFGGELRANVAPYGLIARGSDWYLAYSQAENRRAVRVADLEDVSILAETFQRPSDFDLTAFWEAWNSLQAETSYPVILRVAPELFPWLSRFFGADIKQAAGQAGLPDEDGWRVLTLSFESIESARGRLLALGGAAEIIAPEALRLSMADFAQQIVAQYQK